jgi:hypothetical protein
MGEAFIVRRGGVVSDTTAAPTITIISEDPTGVTFTLTNNDDNTAIISYEVDDEYGAVELAAAATSSNITVALAAGTYTLTAYATVVGEVATSSDEVVEIVQIFEFELLFDSLTADDGDPIALPTTQIDITGLSIGKNDELRMVYTFVGDSSSSTSTYDLRANDITTNYERQELTGFGTSFFAGRASNSIFASSNSNRKTAGFVDIKVSENSRFVAQSQFARAIGGDSAGIDNLNINIVNTDTVTSITKLTVISNRTDGIAADSRIRLYKVNTGDA